MQLLIIFSLILSSALCESNYDFVNYQYDTGRIGRSEDTHTDIQNYVNKVFPQITEEELPPIYIRHIPSPVKNVPIVPIIPVPPPQRVARLNEQDPLQVQASENVYVVNDAAPNTQFEARSRSSRQNVQDTHQVQASQNVYVVSAIPPNAQLGARSLVVKHLPSHIEIKGEQTANRIGRVEKIPFGERIFTPTLHAPGNVEQVEVQQPQVHVDQQQVQNVGQFEQQQKLAAQDIQLVNGFTPEVHQATLGHLARVAAIRARHIET